MKPFHYAMLALLLAAGFAGGLALVPSESDLAVIYYRGRNFTDARPLLEKRFASGERSADVVLPLAELYVQDGHIDKALKLLEGVRTSGGDQVTLFQKIAEFEKFNEQTQDYLQTLETVNRMSGSADGLRSLADLYRYTNNTAKLIPALETLIARYDAEPDEYLELSGLLAADGRYPEAANTMERMEKRHPAAISAESTELLISVLLDSGQPDEAFRRAGHWIEMHRTPESVVRFASLLRNNGKPELALNLFTPVESSIEQDEVLFPEWIETATAAGKSADALARLEKVRKTRGLTDGLIGPYINLAADGGDLSRAVEAARQFGFHRLPGPLAASLVERAFNADQPATATAIAVAGGPGFLNAWPLLGARAAFHQGDSKEATHLLAAVENSPTLSTDDRLATADMEASLGRNREAAAQLSHIAWGSAPDYALMEASRLYVRIHQPEAGMRQLDEARSQRRTPASAAAWAMVAAAAGKGDAVAQWLALLPTGAVAASTLDDLSYIAQDHGQTGLAVAVAERVLRERPDEPRRMQLARALIDDHQPQAALPHLRVLMKIGMPQAEDVYASALFGAVHDGGKGASAELKTELRDYWNRKLSAAGTDEQQQLDLIYGLLDLEAWGDVLPRLETLARKKEELGPLFVETAMKAGKRAEAIGFLKTGLARPDLLSETRESLIYALIDAAGEVEALPYMRQLALNGVGTWGPAYEEALGKLDRDGELYEYWRARLGGASAPPDERRGIAWKLIERGKPEWARAVFSELAASAGPADPDVSEWLFLEGEKPRAEVLDALEQRARSSHGNERTGWLNHLLDLGGSGGSERALAVIAEAPPRPGEGGAGFDVYARALAARNETATLTEAIGREAAATVDGGSVRRLAARALELGGPIAALPAFERLEQFSPSDREVLHWLGVADYTRARYSSAKRRLALLLASTEGGWDDNYFLGQMLWREGQVTRARIHFARAISLIENLNPVPRDAQVAHAGALFRCGYMQRGLAEFRRLIAAEPRSGELRADYAALLIDYRRFREAEDVLEAEADSGSDRLGLLRAQLLSETGHTGEALTLMDTLDGRNSPDGTIPAAYSVIAESAGRTRMALELIARARALDPSNEDYSAEAAEIERNNASDLRFTTESRHIAGLETDDIFRIASRVSLSGALHAMLSSEQAIVAISSLQQRDGSTAAFAGTMRRAEAALEWEAEGGTRVKGSLFLGGSVAGAGIVATRPDRFGSASLIAEYHKPDWNFGQSIAQGGTRDRAEVREQGRIGERITVQGGAAANRYDLPGLPGAARSVSASATVSAPLSRQPQISAEYSLDAEYVTGLLTLFTGPGHAYQPIVLTSREVHQIGIRGEQKLSKNLRATGAAGVSMDRLGGTAPYYAAGFAYDNRGHLKASVDYDRRLYRYGPARVASGLRLGLFWSF